MLLDHLELLFMFIYDFIHVTCRGYDWERGGEREKGEKEGEGEEWGWKWRCQKTSRKRDDVNAGRRGLCKSLYLW